MDILTHLIRESFIIGNGDAFYLATITKQGGMKLSPDKIAVYNITAGVPTPIAEYDEVYTTIVNLITGGEPIKVVGKPRGRRGGRRKKVEVTQ